MAKFEGDQSIPAALLDLYRGTLNPHPTGKVVKKRYPFRMPRMQEGGRGVHADQITQRARFKEAIQDFKGISSSDRARWYAAEPPWSSFLWYYNYFIMSSLVGNANLDQGGIGVIKSIQYVSKSIPTGGDEAITIAAVDPAKTVVMLFGNSYISDTVHHYDGISNDNTVIDVNLSPSIDPAISEVILNGAGGRMEIYEGDGTGNWGDWFVVSVAAAKIQIKLQNLETAALFGWSMDIIEHKAQTVYPYVKTIAAEAITLSWPVTPSVAAVIGAIVIEYI